MSKNKAIKILGYIIIPISFSGMIIFGCILNDEKVVIAFFALGFFSIILSILYWINTE